ncbi:DUF3108 domain-containing protein [Rhodocyclaceae bacterium SMB388]
MMRALHRLMFMALVSTAVFVSGPVVAAGNASAAAPGQSIAWPESGQIRYDVLHGDGGIKLGEAEHRWQHDGRRYQMQTELETTGLAGMLYSFRYIQHSEGVVEDGMLRPELFRVVQQGREPEVARLDWSALEATIERRGRVRTYPIAANDQDVLSVWHLFGLLQERVIPQHLSVVTNRRVSPVAITALGAERVRLPVGELATQRVRVAALSGKLTIELWLSEAHGRMPVRILMTDDKGEVLDQRAVSIVLNQ